jgi:hypothetical protein
VDHVAAKGSAVNMKEGRKAIEKKIDSKFSKLFPSSIGSKLVVYHYCDINAAISIIQNRSFWASNFRYLNDQTEGRWYDKVNSEVFEEFERKGFPREIRKRFELISNLKNKQNELHTRMDGYLVCFSNAPDVLSQWRAYADDGRGLAIGIDVGEIENLKRRVWRNSNYAFVKVEYNAKIQRKRISHLLSIFLKEISRGMAEFTARDWETLSFKLYAEMEQFRYEFKNPAFEEEKEYRFVRGVFPFDKNLDSLDGVLFRKSQIGLLPYEILKFENSIFPIREIWIGPKCKQEETQLGLKMMLKKYGFDVAKISIRQSAATYR